MYQNKLQIHLDNKHLFCTTRCQTLLGTEDSTMKRQSSSIINDTAQVKVHWGSPTPLWWEIFCYANLKEHLWNGEDAVLCPSHWISLVLSHPDAQWWHTGGAQIFSVLTQRNCFSLCVFPIEKPGILSFHLQWGKVYYNLSFADWWEGQKAMGRLY